MNKKIINEVTKKEGTILNEGKTEIEKAIEKPKENDKGKKP